MHEMGLAQGILDVVLGLAESHPVRRVRVRVGALQQVAPESLQFWFQMLAADTVAADAQLESSEVPARLRCGGCEYVGEFRPPPFQCPQCGTAGIEITGGAELLVDAIELDDEWRYRPADEAGVSVASVGIEHLLGHASATREMSEEEFWRHASGR